MCASCGCGCKHGIAAKGCKCKCKDCREARTMSVEKSHLIRKAMRGFEEIADAVLDDVYEDDLVVDEYGNVYALVELEGVEKNANTATSLGAIPYVGGIAAPGYNASQTRKGRKAAVAGRTYGSQAVYGGLAGTAASAGVLAHASRKAGGLEENIAHGLSPKAKLAVLATGMTGAAYGARRAYQNAQKRGDIVEKGLPSVARQAIRAGQGSEAFGPNSAMQWRLGAHNTGRTISREISSPSGSVARSGVSINAAQGAKEAYRARAGMRSATDRGKLGGRLGKERLARATGLRQAKQDQIAESIRQNRLMNGRGVLP